MSNKQKMKNKTKKKIIIIIACIIALAMIFGVLAIAFLHFQEQNNNELNLDGMNTLYNKEVLNETSENEESEGNNLLVVEISNENKTNENENATNNKDASDTNDTVKTIDTPYYIKINNQANVVTVYKKNTKGEYTVPVKAMICSIGTATPESGVYSISDKYTWRLLQGDVYGQYACRITGHILFHSVPYIEKDKSTLEWWEYDKLGTKASLGCIRLKVEDAKWIYDNCIKGTNVEFYSSSNPGPLGKPTAEKISDDEEVRNWDPTDPDKNNPWKEYLENKEKEETQETVAKPVEENKNTVNNTAINNTVVNNTTTNNTVTNNTINEGSTNKTQNETNQVTTNSSQNKNTVTNATNNANIGVNKIQ